MLKKKHRRICILLSILMLISNLCVCVFGHESSDEAKGKEYTMKNNEYIFADENGIILTTDKVQKKVSLGKDGTFLCTSFVNLVSGTEYVKEAGVEFYVEADGVAYSGAAKGWQFVGIEKTTLQNGEEELSYTIKNGDIKITRHYVVYPGTGIIQEWTELQNLSARSVTLSSPSVFEKSLYFGNADKSEFCYMTGGANFTGANMLKKNVLSGYSRTFDSRDNPEIITVDGANRQSINDNNVGSAIYQQFYCVCDTLAEEGTFITFDYAGHWTAKASEASGRLTLGVTVSMKDRELEAGESIVLPKSMQGVFVGDIDDMGNEILDYTYQYKWDYTNEDYFAQVKAYQWVSGTQTHNAFALINNLRYLGAELIHIDDSWYTSKATWNNRKGDDFAAINQYAEKHGINMTVWLAAWHADTVGADENSPLITNPEWEINPDPDNWYGKRLNLAEDGVYRWIGNLLNSKVALWGDFMWRFDGTMVWPNDRSDNDMLDQSNNWYALMKEFKDTNPESGIYGCSSGGESITIEAARYADVQQTSDGNDHHYSGYWLSLIVPPDKLTSSTESDYDRTIWGSYSKNNRGNLQMSWQIGMVNANADMSDADKDALRRDVELYKYLKSQGVVGRWVKVYRPVLDSGDETYFLQKMNRDLTKGYIAIRRCDDMIGKTVTVYPKGLIENETYKVTFLEDSDVKIEKSGAELMGEGISISTLRQGEMIFFNLDNRPGSGTDADAPSAPANVTKTVSTYLHKTGVELNWEPATDNNWISYYEIIKNGVAIDKVSIGTTYFTDDDYSSDDVYKVRTVDGDGNGSDAVTAIGELIEPSEKNEDDGEKIRFNYTEDFSNKQGVDGWYYMNGMMTGKTTEMKWNDSVGYYEGSSAFAQIRNEKLHPGTSTDSVIKWVAPRDGTVSLQSRVAKYEDSQGDGIVVSVKYNDTVFVDKVLIAADDFDGVDFNDILTVSRGDEFFFILNANGNNAYDTAAWDITFEYIIPSQEEDTDASEESDTDTDYTDITDTKRPDTDEPDADDTPVKSYAIGITVAVALLIAGVAAVFVGNKMKK